MSAPARTPASCTGFTGAWFASGEPCDDDLRTHPPMPPPVFLVTFEYAKRSFKCVLLDWDAPIGRSARQWVVTVAGRPVWSFEAGAQDTKESVQREVELWWDTQYTATH